MSGGAGPPELVEVADQVFAYIQPDGSWWINNTGSVVGGKAVVGIDACSTRARTSANLERIATVSHAPVTTLINTHHHGDHTFGNYLFDAATIVAHENCRAALPRAGLPPEPGVWDPVARHRGCARRHGRLQRWPAHLLRVNRDRPEETTDV